MWDMMELVQPSVCHRVDKRMDKRLILRQSPRRVVYINTSASRNSVSRPERDMVRFMTKTSHLSPRYVGDGGFALDRTDGFLFSSPTRSSPSGFPIPCVEWLIAHFDNICLAQLCHAGCLPHIQFIGVTCAVSD